MADTFNFPFHTVRDQYPNEDGMKLGGSYEFHAKPNAPYQRTFILTFAGMWYYGDGVSVGTLSSTVKATTNMLALQNFYAAHGMWSTFIYPHPRLGNVNVKFGKPLATPEETGNCGAVKGFELELVEQP